MAKEQVLLATMAGRASATAGRDRRAIEAGRRLQREARASYDARRSAAVTDAPSKPAGPTRRGTPTGSAAFVERIKAALAAA